MAQVRFVLHDKKKDGKYSILLWYRCQVGGIYKKLVGETIHKRNWSTKTQRALPSTPQAFELNRYLDEREQQIVDCVREIRMTNARVSKQALITRLSGAKMEFWEYADKFLETPPQEVGPRTLQIYDRMFNNLRIAAPGLSFSEVGQGTVDLYIKHRRKLRMNDSTIRNEITKLRAFLNYAKKAQIIASTPTLEFNISGVDPGEIYLTEEEILKIYQLIGTEALANYPGIANYCRYFVLGTQIGVRVSDLEIKPEYVSSIKTKDNRTVKIATVMPEKTQDVVVIPFTALAEQVMKYYKWQIPRFNDQDLNEHVKTLARLAGIKDVCVWREKIDGEIIETVYEKWQLVSSHTMRRSFATNLHRRGVPSPMIMKITGHKTERDFLKYIRLDKHEAAAAISEYM